jgi:sugar phosphate permease
VLADIAAGATVVAVPLLYGAGILRFWELLVLVFLLSSINTPGDSARFALIPALARRAAMPVERANAADRAIARLAQIVGPLLAGVLIALLGAANVLFLDAATFVLSATLVAIGVPAALSEHARVDDVGARLGYLSELRDGLRFVRNNSLVLSMVLVATVTNFLDVPLLTVLMPVYARDNYGSAASFGGIVGALAAGAFLGTLVFGAVGQRLPRRLTFIVSFVIAPMIIYIALLSTPPLAVLVAAAALGGLISGPINPTYATVIQEQTPPQMLGRVFGALQSLAMAGMPVGNALTGFAVQGLGVNITIIAMASIYLAVTLSMFLRPALRQMDVRAKS